jgi:hypothetical protein
MDKVMKIIGLSSLAFSSAIFALLLGEIISANWLVAEHLDADAAISNWQTTTAKALGIFHEHMGNLEFSKLAAVNGLIWVFTEKTYYVALLLVAFVGYFSLQLKVLKPPLVANQPKISSAGYGKDTKSEVSKLQKSEAFRKYQ